MKWGGNAVVFQGLSPLFFGSTMEYWKFCKQQAKKSLKN